jgi:TonB family protein
MTITGVQKSNEIELFVMEEKPVIIIKKLIEKPKTPSVSTHLMRPTAEEKKAGNQMVIEQQKEVAEKPQEEISKNIKSPIVVEKLIPPHKEIFEDASKSQIARLPQTTIPAVQNEDLQKAHRERQEGISLASTQGKSSPVNSGSNDGETGLKTSPLRQPFPSSDDMIRFGSEDGPRFLRREMPIYPIMARRLGREGKVVLRLTIDEKGNLLNVEVLKGAGYGLTEAAVEAVRRSKFLPAKKEGKPVSSRAILPVRFTLRTSE